MPAAAAAADANAVKSLHLMASGIVAAVVAAAVAAVAAAVAAAVVSGRAKKDAATPPYHHRPR